MGVVALSKRAVSQLKTRKLMRFLDRYKGFEFPRPRELGGLKDVALGALQQRKATL